MSIKSLTTLTVSLDSLLPKLPHASFLKVDCNKPSPQAFTQQALAFVASQPAPRSNYSFSNNNLGQLLGMPFARSRSQRKANILGRILGSMLGGNLYNRYQDAKALKRFYNNNDNVPRGLSLNLSREPSNYNSSRPKFSDLSLLRNALGSHFALKHDDFKNSTQPMPLSITVKAEKKPTFDDDVRRLIAARNAQSDVNCKKTSSFDAGYGLSLSSNKPASNIEPTGFTTSANRQQATLNYGNSSIAFNQADQSVIVTDRTTHKSFKIWGDPHEEMANSKTDFKGQKTYKMADGTKMTLLTGNSSGNKDPNAPTTVQSAIFSKNGLDAIKVDNISNQYSGTQEKPGQGITAEIISPKDAKKAVRDSVTTVTVNADGTLKN
jgi:Domain of Unknown Function (DUF1521)